MRDIVQIAIRIPREWLDLADEVARSMSRPGWEATRTDAIRAAIIEGLKRLLEGSHGTDHSRGR